MWLSLISSDATPSNRSVWKVCASGREVAQKADFIFTMVPDTPHVAAALLNADGIAEGLHPDKTVIDMSSISHSTPRCSPGASASWVATT